MSNMKTLQDYVSFKRGEIIPASSLLPGKYRVITGGAESKLTSSKYNRLPPCLVISSSGSAGYVSFWKEPVLVTDAFTISPKHTGCNITYIYYFLKLLQPQIMARARGSIIPHVYPKDIAGIRIPNTPLDTQRKIAGILSALDDKIELNDKINQKLNELARLIYDYWFVQFDFPDENGRPYRTSGGKMVYNDLLKREIPEGWKTKHLDKILAFERGTEPGSKAYLNKTINDSCIKFHRVGDMLGNCSTWIDSSEFKLYRVKPGDVLVSFDATIGRIATCVDGAISGGIRHIYDPDKNISDAFIWQLFQSQKIQDQMLQFVSGRGSSLAHAGGVIKELAIPYNMATIQKYQSIVNPMYQLYINNQLESRQLAQLRDWLLPMLMNGQVVVN